MFAIVLAIGNRHKSGLSCGGEAEQSVIFACC